MSSSVYFINKGINKPIKFKGLKAQYIAYLGVGLLVLFILFAVLYIIGLNLIICMTVIGSLGSLLFTQVYRFSHKYGQYGLLKEAAKRKIPGALKINSRDFFIRLKKNF